MKSLWKVSAIAAAVLGSAVAQADVVLPDTATGTGSSLVLFVKDNTPGAAPDRVYARDLGPLLDSVLTQAQATAGVAGVQQFGYTLPTYTADDNLTEFLGGGSSFTWTIMAADAAGGGAFQQRYLTTTQIDLATEPNLPTNTILRGAWSAITAMFGEVNAALDDVPNDSTQINGQWGQNPGLFTNMTDWNSGGVQNQNALGATANLYVLVTSAGAAGNFSPSRVFQGVSVRLLANGTLEAVVSTPEVPLPPAVFLLGSAIAALTGVARRRRQGQPEGVVAA